MKPEKISENHYKYDGMLIVLAEGEYDPSDDASVEAALQSVKNDVVRDAIAGE